MTWKIEFTPAALKQLKKISSENGRRILNFLRTKVSDNPRAHGKMLKGALREFWRYRIGNYRILARIEDDRIVVLIVHIGHRKDIYR